MVKSYYEGTQRSRQERPGEVAENSSGIERPQAFARISVEIEDTLDGTPRKKSRIARDDVNKESNENRNNWKVCFGVDRHKKGRERVERREDSKNKT
ncbi:hypothetical protein Tco_1323419 [Tanacetum coccineum]